MKHLLLFRPLLIAYLIFTGCSPKETFYFSNNQDSYGHYQKKKQLASLPDNKEIIAEPNKLNQPTSANEPIIAATNASATNSEDLILPGQAHVADLNPSLLNKKVKIGSDGQVVKSKKLPKKVLKKYSDEPVDAKKVNGTALIGFLFSLGYIGFFIIPSIPLGLLLLGLVGTVVSIMGLIKIKKNPDKYSGKGFAWAGIIISILFAIFFTGIIIAFSNFY